MCIFLHQILPPILGGRLEPGPGLPCLSSGSKTLFSMTAQRSLPTTSRSPYFAVWVGWGFEPLAVERANGKPALSHQTTRLQTTNHGEADQLCFSCAETGWLPLRHPKRNQLLWTTPSGAITEASTEAPGKQAPGVHDAAT